MSPLLATEVRHEQDVVLARQRARQIAGLLGFDLQDQTRIATAVSEIARNAFQYAGGGRVEFRLEPGTPQEFVVRVRDQGPGIVDLNAVLDGRRAPTAGMGMGMGLVGARRVMDRFEAESTPGAGTVITLGKLLPKKAPPITDQDLARVADELPRRASASPFEEIQRQNQELLRTLEELRAQQAETAQLNRELEETNRGVVALYAELDERAVALQRASELKTRFLSNMSHEFRTPLNSIRSLARFLLDPADGALSAEKERQARYVLKAAESLTELVNDLLDLAKVEAGKVEVRAEAFEASNLFAALRGMFRPLVDPAAPVGLIFDEPDAIPTLETDEGKVAQILRNFISNALKFTERGEVRVAASAGLGDRIAFSVSDTGIGIAAEDLGRIFEEFSQVEGPVQRRVKGTGLGLPLSRKLAELLGGSVSVSSRPGTGSTFTATIPRRYGARATLPEFKSESEPDPPAPAPAAPASAPERIPILVVEDDPATLYLYEKHLEGSDYQIVPARSIGEARRALETVTPAAVLLDIRFELESGWTLLTELKARAATQRLPVIVLTLIDGREQALALGADDFCLKPVERSWLLDRLGSLEPWTALETILIIDDDEAARYVLRGLLAAETRATILEASNGTEGLRRARADRPQAIFLDLVMPDMTGFEVLDRLRSDPVMSAIPVVVHSSQVLDDQERRRLSAGSAAILSKTGASRDAALSSLRAALAKMGVDPANPRRGVRA